MTKRTRYNKMSLNNLSEATTQNTSVDISNNDTLKAGKITIIKRSGKKEAFSPEKLRNICLWATNSDVLTDELIRDTEIKLHKEIRIQDMYQQLISTAVNKISMLFPVWEDIAARLYLVQVYKETYGISKASEYPHIKDILQKGIEHRILDKSTIEKYTKDELEEINSFIAPERDLIFNYKGLITFFDKYCLNYTKTKKLELPQHSYMRVALALNVREKDRLTKVKATYDALSKHHYTVATPIIMNALTPSQQLSSCVLNTVSDDSHNILDTGKNLGIYSKYKGGTALDISNIRAKGSYIEGAQGYSSGPVPFLKFYETIMKAWNQGGKRSGSCAIYFDWFHLDVFDVLALRSNGGTDENRARGLQYGVKLHQYFLDKVKANEDISLFDPKDTPNLIGKFGQEFNEIYEDYVSKTSIKRKTVKAQTLWESIIKYRTETGNIYLFHYENVNEVSMLNRYIGSSNLCVEVIIPSRSSKTISEELIQKENGESEIVKRYTAGEIGLCNLSAINLDVWKDLTDEEKDQLVMTVVRTLDNTVDLAYYPVKEGKYSNDKYRYLGIGVLNYANYLASNQIVIDSSEAREETAELYDDLYYRIYSASVDLAVEKGRFPGFYETEWSNGLTPVHKANPKALALTEFKPDMDKWDALGERVKTFGIRNAYLGAQMPTATTGLSVNATEGTEPIHDFFYKEEGTLTIPTLAPNFRKNSKYYKKAFDCNQFSLMKNAAIRQIYIDQAQSVNTYITRPDSLMDLTMLHLHYFDLGGKTLYYLKQQKESMDEVCESCT